MIMKNPREVPKLAGVGVLRPQDGIKILLRPPVKNLALATNLFILLQARLIADDHSVSYECLMRWCSTMILREDDVYMVRPHWLTS